MVKVLCFLLLWCYHHKKEKRLLAFFENSDSSYLGDFCSFQNDFLMSHLLCYLPLAPGGSIGIIPYDGVHFYASIGLYPDIWSKASLDMTVKVAFLDTSLLCRLSVKEITLYNVDGPQKDLR